MIPTCFKAYDIRGTFPRMLNAPLALALGQAAAELTPCGTVVVGRDARLSGPALRDALVAGLRAGGVTVTDLGICGTEEIYHAAAGLSSGVGPFDLGIMITGSHNPADENGFKLVRRGAVPVSRDSGLDALGRRVGELLASGCTAPACPPAPDAAPVAGAPTAAPGPEAAPRFRRAYLDWLLRASGLKELAGRPGGMGHRLTVVADAGNGCAGLALAGLLPELPCEVLGLNLTPDGTFPHGVPNPLLPERREAAARAVRAHGADFGVAWDGDFDRCFFYDGEGRFIEGYYCVGLLASELLRRTPGAAVVHDTRVYWNTQEVVRAAGGRPVMGKTGHAFMKERMRAENALYGGEMSAHHYFRDFAFCDSGMLPWLLVLALLARSGRSLAELVDSRMAAYPCSGEINRRADNAAELMEAARRRYAPQAISEDAIDGVNLEFPQWRFNLRRSNTEPLLRLNVESRGDRALLEDRTGELLAMLDAGGAQPV